MDKSAFVKTMIEVLKYDSSYKTLEGRDQLIRLLSRAKANFLPQYGFVGRAFLTRDGKLLNGDFPYRCLMRQMKE